VSTSNIPEENADEMSPIGGESLHSPSDPVDSVSESNDVPQSGSSPRSWLHHIGTVLAVVSTGIVLTQLFGNLNKLPEFRPTATGLVGIALSVVFLITASYAQAFGWRALIIAGGNAISPGGAFKIVGTTQINKYLPGNIFHFVGRATLALEEGIPLEISAASMGIEAILYVLSSVLAGTIGLLLGARISPWALIRVQAGDHPMVIGLILSAILVISIVLLFFDFRRFNTEEIVTRVYRFLTPGTLALNLGISTSIFLMNGIILKLLLFALWGDGGAAVDIVWYELSAIFALSWVIGFIVPGSPGGIGVREAILLLFLTPLTGPGTAALIALVARLMTSLSDVLVYVVARAWKVN